LWRTGSIPGYPRNSLKNPYKEPGNYSATFYLRTQNQVIYKKSINITVNEFTYHIEFHTEKSIYKIGENISINITIENHNPFDVHLAKPDLADIVLDVKILTPKGITVTKLTYFNGLDFIMIPAFSSYTQSGLNFSSNMFDFRNTEKGITNYQFKDIGIYTIWIEYRSYHDWDYSLDPVQFQIIP